MIPNEGIDELAAEIGRRYDEAGRGPSQSAVRGGGPRVYQDEPGGQPFILFLGAECAAAAGLPGKEQLARQIIDLVSGDEELAALHPLMRRGAGPLAELGGGELLPLFYDLMEELTKQASGKIYRMFLKFYANIPVPLFYQDLALLMRAGFFERVLTTNIDTLLEQGLDIVGLQAGYDYQVTSLGMARAEHPGGYADPAEAGEAASPRQVIKLFGDLSQGQVNIAPDEINGALRSQRRYVKSELEGDILMVGYNFESRPINDWLKHGGERRRQLWWVSGGGPPVGGPALINSWAERVRYITGHAGSPQEFFSQLKLRLLRRPSPQPRDASGYGGGEGSESHDPEAPVTAPGAEPEEHVEGEGGAAEAAGPAPTTPGEPEEAGLIENLRGNIRRSQAVLLSLEQTAPPGDLPANLRAQAAYQKQQIAEMEDKIRSLAGSRKVVTEALEAIVGEVQRACAFGAGGSAGRAVDDSAVAFVRAQQQAVLNQYERDEPNHFVVSAAVGAAVMMAERLCVELGQEVVSQEHVRRLAAFAPSVAGRGII